MKGKKEDDVTVEQMRFGNRSTAKKEAKKRGRPLKYPGDKKEKKLYPSEDHFFKRSLRA